jgi:signal transduction histidine kinase/CheY-like chemotaxis protein
MVEVVDEARPAVLEMLVGAQAAKNADKKGAAILVCDDHEDIVDMLVAVLELEGYAPAPAHGGTQALEVMRRRPIDLVLLDKSMPDIDGFEVCRRIKGMFPGRFLPVILVTAKADKSDKIAGLSSADDYITKPFDLEEVLAKVRVMLRIKGVEDQLYQRHSELASFNAVAKVVGESLILEEMLHDSLAEILRLMDLPCGWIFLCDGDEEDGAPAVYLGPEREKLSARRYDLRALRPLAGRATGCPDAWLDGPFRARHGLASCVSIPLKAKGHAHGYMALCDRRGDALAPEGSKLQVLSSLGAELGIAIEHALLYRDAQRTVEKLREIDALKSQFISTASHEFRTPLSIIKGFANILKRKEAFGFDKETERGYLGLIDGQINVLSSLVDDMLNASRIESGHVEVRAEDVELLPFIARTMLPIALNARDRDIAVTVEGSRNLRVRVDPNHLEHVVSNLLSNAVKYSDDGTTVTARAYAEDGMARVEITDHGVGILPEQLPALFGRFVRLDNRRSVEAGGTGLGLYIARNSVEANGGRIWAESTPEQGSVFSFTLPLSP